MKKNISYKTIILLILIIGFASLIRFYDLKNRGLINGDETQYALPGALDTPLPEADKLHIVIL